MSDVGLGTRRDGDLARLQELFSRSGSASVPLRDEGRRREPSTAREVCSLQLTLVPTPILLLTQP